MSKIITLTFNPAIDKSTTVSAMIPEKKLKCTDAVYEPGGGGINVSRAIKKLGGDSCAIYLAGGYTGKMFSHLLQNENIDSAAIEIRGNTRENMIVLETASNHQFRFGMPGPSVREQEWEQCLTQIENSKEAAYIVASGSLPKGIPVAIYSRIARIAQSKNSKLIVDSSGDALKEAVQAGVYLIKPNLRELCTLAGKEKLGIEEAAFTANDLITKGKCEIVVVSLGAAGALLATRSKVLRLITPPLKIKSTVGAGDSMVAGIVLSLSQNKSVLEAARYGVACGTAATQNTGTELCRKEDADRLYKLIRQDEVNGI